MARTSLPSPRLPVFAALAQASLAANDGGIAQIPLTAVGMATVVVYEDWDDDDHRLADERQIRCQLSREGGAYEDALDFSDPVAL